MGENDSNRQKLDDQWARIEEHYRSGKPLAARVIEASREGLFVEVGSIHGIVASPTYAYTADAETAAQLSREELFERARANMVGKEILTYCKTSTQARRSRETSSHSKLKVSTLIWVAPSASFPPGS